MGNCAIKPKVLKDSEEDLIPVERETVAPAEKNENIAPNAAEEAAVAARRSEKGKEILIEDDVDEHNKRSSLSHLFHEDKPVVVKEVTDLTPTKPAEPNNKSDPFLDVSKLDTSDLTPNNAKGQEETFDVQARNDVEVKIPKDSEVKTPENPKPNETEKKEVNFSDNWEVKFPEESEAKKTSKVDEVAEETKLPGVSVSELSEMKVVKESDVPQVLEDKSIKEVSSKDPIPELSEVKVAKESDVSQLTEDKNIQEVSSKVYAPELSETKSAKESDVPQVLEDKNTSEVSEVSAPQLSGIQVTKESDVSEVLEDKNIQEVSEDKSDEVKVAESGLLKVSEVKSTEDLEIQVPKVFEAKTPETLTVKVTDKSEVKTDEETLKAKNAEEIEAPAEFVDAKEKIEKSDQDKEKDEPSEKKQVRRVNII